MQPKILDSLPNKAINFLASFFYFKACLYGADGLDSIHEKSYIQQNTIQSNTLFVNEDKKNGEYFYQLGQNYAKSQNWSQAIDAYKKALELRPGDPDIEVGLGESLLSENLSQENLKESEDLFQKVINDYPLNTNAQEGLKKVQALFQIKRKEEALHEVQRKELQLKASKLNQSPKNGEIFYKLGRAYAQAEMWDKAIDAYEKALEMMPADPDTEVSLGYALLFENSSPKNLEKSEELFQHVLKEHPRYVDAQEGLKRVQALLPKKQKNKEQPAVQKGEVKSKEGEGNKTSKNGEDFYQLGRDYAKNENWNKAIDAYKKALELIPGDPDTEVSLGYAILAQYHSRQFLEEGAELFQHVLKGHPDYVDAQVGLKRIQAIIHPDEKKEKEENEKAKAREWADLQQWKAKELSKEGAYQEAIDVYLELIEVNPNNPEYFFNLGSEYSKMKLHCYAINAFAQSLTLKPDYAEAAVALGKQYWLIHDFCNARKSFQIALESSPDDINALISAAGLEAELLNFCLAENYYQRALEIDPENVDVIKPYAYMLYNLHRYREAEQDYRYLTDRDTNPNANKMMLFDVSSYSRPTFFTGGGAAEERENDLFSDTWVAAIQYINAEAGCVVPFKEHFRITAKGKIGITRQLLLVSKLTQFDVKYNAGGIRGEWFYGPYWTFVADLNFEQVSNNDRNALLPVAKRFLFEPSLSFRYIRGPNRLSVGVTTDSFIYRNFAKVQLDVDTRETVAIGYQHDFGDNRFAGVDAAWLWYQDPVNNQEQDLDLWAQTGIPYVEDLLSLRFDSVYRHFYHTVSGYYSFQYELTNWLKLRFFKTWKETYQCEFLYWHGWRITRGKNPQQQIIVVPTPTAIPFTTVDNQIDQLFLNLLYTPTTYCAVSLNGFYYHDSFDYTAYGAKIHLDWRF